MYLCRLRLFLTSGASGPGNTLGGFLLLHLWEGELILLLMTRGLALQQKIALQVLIAGWSYALLLTHNVEAFLVLISLPSTPQN